MGYHVWPVKAGISYGLDLLLNAGSALPFDEGIWAFQIDLCHSSRVRNVHSHYNPSPRGRIGRNEDQATFYSFKNPINALVYQEGYGFLCAFRKKCGFFIIQQNFAGIFILVQGECLTVYGDTFKVKMFAEKALWRTLVDNLAFIHDHQFITQCFSFIHVMGGEDDGFALGLNALYQ